MRYRRSSVTMGRFMEVAVLLVALGRVDGVSYLLANVDRVRAVAGKNGGFFRVDYPQLGRNVTGTVAPYSWAYTVIDSVVRVTVGVETKAFVIHVFGKDMSVYGYKNNDSAVFSPLPISALGSRYVVSTCRGSTDHVVLVIANYNQKTDVDITLKLDGYVTYNMTYTDGDTIHVSLDEYQTFTLKSAYDLTGTVVSTTRNVAVFSGAMTGDHVYTVAQQLPVRHHGAEFVLSTRDFSYVRDSTYQLQVVSDQKDTEIMLNNGSTFSLGDNRVYRQNLLHNETLYFNTTRPVISTLCRKTAIINYKGFVVVTPVHYFMNNAQVILANCINILTKQHVTSIEVFRSDMTPAALDWVDIPGSDYKVGKTCYHSSYFVRSNNRFAVYGFVYDIINGGFHFPADTSTTRAAAGTTASRTTPPPPTTTAFAATTTSGTKLGGFTSQSTNRSSPESIPSPILAGVFMGGVAAGAVIVILVCLTAYVLVIRRRYDLTVKKQGDIPAFVEHPTYTGLSAGADINTYAIIGQTSRSQQDTTHGSLVTPDYQTIELQMYPRPQS